MLSSSVCGTGQVTREDLDYARQDVKCTTALLNAMKKEFDRHPIDLLPEKAYSPATIAKGYMESMGIVPPLQKFDIPEKIQGVAMQSYYGGRAECRVRRTEVISTPNILQRLEPRPFSFLLIPQVDSQGGLPANVDSNHFTLVTSYTSNRSD